MVIRFLSSTKNCIKKISIVSHHILNIYLDENEK